jgi:hypothetical protein
MTTSLSSPQAFAVQVHFNRLGPSDATLVVVAVGTEVYAATAPEPMAALQTAAHDAAVDLAARGWPIAEALLIECGEEALHPRDPMANPLLQTAPLLSEYQPLGGTS